MQFQQVQPEARRGVAVAAHGVNLATKTGVIHQHGSDDNHCGKAQQRQRQAVVIAVGGGEGEPVDAVHKPVREAVQPGAFGGVHQQPVVDVQRGDGDDDCRHPQPVDQKAVNQSEQQTDRHGEQQRQRKITAVGNHPACHNVLRNRRHRRERNINPAGDQHHKQPAGEDAENGVAGGNVRQVAQREKLVGADAKPHGQRNHQQSQPEFMLPDEAGKTHVIH